MFCFSFGNNNFEVKAKEHVKNNDNLSIFQMWHLPSSLASSASGANSTVGATVPLNLGITEPSTTGSATHQITSNSETMQVQSSVKDEFNNSSYTGADYSLQNLDSYYKTNSSASAENKEFSASSQQENQQPPTTVKSDVDYSAPNSSSNEHILPTNHYDYPAYYSTV